MPFLIHPLPRPPDRLKPFTSYQFRVKATNDIGDSAYSEESEAITTLQDGEQREFSSVPEIRVLLCRERPGTFSAPFPHFSRFLPAAAPDEAPAVLSVTPHTTTSVLICWKVSGTSFSSVP